MMKPSDDPKPNQPSAYVDPLELWDSPNSTIHRAKRFKSGEEVETHPPASRDFMDIMSMAWFRPSVSNYRAILNDTNISLRRSSTWMAIAFGLQIVLVLVVFAIAGPNETIDRNVYNDTESSGAGAFCGVLICLPFIVTLSLFLYSIFIVGLPNVAAQLFGGEGTYEQTAFLYAALYAPAYGIGAVLSLIIENGGDWASYIGLVLGVYMVVLMTIAIRAAHEINWFKSFVSVISLPILIIAFAFCLTLQFG